MVKDLEKELDEILNNFNTKLDENKKEKERKKQELEQHKKSFLNLVENTIKPIMEKFKDFLEKKGQTCNISVRGIYEWEKSNMPNITFEVFPPYHKQYQLQGSNPLITFQVGQDNKIGIFSRAMMPSGGGHAGPMKYYGSDKITSKFVEEEISNLIKECYDRDWKTYYFD